MNNKTKIFGLATLILSAPSVLANQLDHTSISAEQSTVILDNLKLQMTSEQRQQLMQVLDSLEIEIKDWSVREEGMQPTRSCCL